VFASTHHGAGTCVDKAVAMDSYAGFTILTVMHLASAISQSGMALTLCHVERSVVTLLFLARQGVLSYWSHNWCA